MTWAFKIAKSLLAFSISLLLVAPLGGVFWQYQAKLYQHQKSVKHQLIQHTPQTELVAFYWPKKKARNLNWKHQGEFEYRGEMYDVVHRQEQDDSVFLWCWWDHEETQLHKKYEKLLALNPFQPQPAPLQNQLLLKWLYGQYFEKKDDYQNPQEQPTLQGNYSFTVLTYCAIPSTPPPQILA